MTKEQKDLLRKMVIFVDPNQSDAIEAALKEVEEWEESLRICRYGLGLTDEEYPYPGTCKVCGEPIRQKRAPVSLSSETPNEPNEAA